MGVLACFGVVALGGRVLGGLGGCHFCEWDAGAIIRVGMVSEEMGFAVPE